MGQLRRLGFDISEGEVTAPAPAACQILKERGLRPYLLIHDGRPAGHQDLPGVKAPLSQGGGCAEGLFHWAGPLTELGHQHSWVGGKNLMGLPAGGWGLGAGSKLRPSPIHSLASHQRVLRAGSGWLLGGKS